MGGNPGLTLSVTPHEVELHYPGAEGVVFQDARLVVKNDSGERVGPLVLGLMVTQEGRELYRGDTPLSALNLPETLGPGEETELSLFRALQREVKGFASRVNMFGYKAALDWTFNISAKVATAPQGEGSVVATARQEWVILWSADPTDPKQAILMVEQSKAADV